MKQFVVVALLGLAGVGVCLAGGSDERSATQPATPTAPAEAKYPDAPQGARIRPDGWFAPLTQVKKPPLPEPIERAFVIPIEDAITGTMYEAIQRKIIRCRARGAQIIIFKMKTPGGSGAAMRKIVRLIIDELRDIYTVAYVAPEAFSAGAVISLACDEIVVSPTAVIGDAMPIMIGPGGQLVPIPDKERGKIESGIRSEIRVLAKRNGYNVELCEAMITITMEIWLIRNTGTCELQIVEAKEWRHRVSGGPKKDKAPAVKSDTSWRYVRTVDGPDELVTMTADEAVEYGIATHTFGDMDALTEHYQITPAPAVLRDNWSERLVAFLTSPAVTGILLMGALFFAYIEMHTPGFGAAGSIAIACFAVLIGSRFLVGMANWWEIALLAIGVVLIMVEVFVTPGFGVPGIAGILCMVVALLAMIVPNAPTQLPIPKTALDWDLLRTGVLALGLGFVAALIAAAIASKYLPKFPIASKLVLAAAKASTAPPASPKAPIQRIQIDETGTVEAPCRPVGKVRIGDDLIDASSEGEMIEKGALVRVLRRDGNRLIIERVT